MTRRLGRGSLWLAVIIAASVITATSRAQEVQGSRAPVSSATQTTGAEDMPIGLPPPPALSREALAERRNSTVPTNPSGALEGSAVLSLETGIDLGRPAEGDLYLLEVSINGWPQRLVIRVYDLDGRLWMPRSEYLGIGLSLDGMPAEAETDSEARVWLDTIPGADISIDQANQTIDFRVPFERLQADIIDLSPNPGYREAVGHYGAMIRLDAFAEYAEVDTGDVGFSRRFAGNLEYRFFGPGVIARSFALADWTDGNNVDYTRLDTFIEWDDRDNVQTLRLGDGISRSASWARTIRMGGLSVGTNFAIRPDIITTPIQQFSDGVTVPTTLDLFVNGESRYSANLDPGAFVLSDLPLNTGVNDVTVVFTDELGRQRQVILPLYASSQLLPEGMFDWALDLGFTRENYGSESFDYGDGFTSALMRYGISDDWLVEGDIGLADGYAGASVGTLFSVNDWFEAGINAGLSESDGLSGYRGGLSLQRSSVRWSAALSQNYASQDYRDLASTFGSEGDRRQFRAALGLNLFEYGNLNTAYALSESFDNDIREVLSVNYGVNLFGNRAHLDWSGSWDYRDDENWSMGFNLSVPLGNRRYASAGSSRNRDGRSYTQELQGSSEDYRLDWRLRARQGNRTQELAELQWDGPRLNILGRAIRDDGNWVAQAQFDNALVWFNDGLHLAGRVDRSFAVVDVGGYGDVDVFRENRFVGRTNEAGHLFIGQLREYEINTLRIDSQDLPIDARIAATQLEVVPSRGNGAIADFGVETVLSAVITLVSNTGEEIPPGARVTYPGSDDGVTGYGGETFLSGALAQSGELRVRWRQGGCTAQISLDLEPGNIPRLGPFTCVMD